MIPRNEKTIRIKPTPKQRLIMKYSYILCNLQAIGFYILLIHFLIYQLPFLSFFPSLVRISEERQEGHYAYNALMYSIFYVQHIVMAASSFKKKMMYINQKYILFERYIYNFLSLGFLIFSFGFTKPILNEANLLFTIPAYITYPFLLLGVFLYLRSINMLGQTLVSEYSYKDICESEYLQHTQYDSKSNERLIDDNIYGICRHPMQLSFLLIFCFGSNMYSIDRLTFILVHGSGILIGVYFEEKRLAKKFKEYSQYKKKVKYKVVPYFI